MKPRSRDAHGRRHDHQRADDRCRRLFPGLGLCAVHRARRLGRSANAASSAMSTASWRCSTSTTPRPPSSRWAGSPSATRSWCGASSTRGTKWPATAMAMSAPATSAEAAFFADIERAKGVLEDLIGAEVAGYRAPSFSIGPGNLWALRQPGARRLPLQLEHLPDPPRPLRHARCAALRAPGGRRADRDPDHHAAPVQPQPAVQRRRLLPAAALRAVALDAAAGQCAPTASRPSSISTPGRSTPSSRASTASTARHAFGTT